MDKSSIISRDEKCKITSFFKENNAINKNNAISIEGLYADDDSTESNLVKSMFKYFYQAGYVKKHKGLYWFDEVCFNHPLKNYLKTCLKVFSVVFLLVITIGIMVISL